MGFTFDQQNRISSSSLCPNESLCQIRRLSFTEKLYWQWRTGNAKNSSTINMLQFPISLNLPWTSICHWDITGEKALLSEELCSESSTAAVTLLCRADVRLLNLSDSLTNPLQSSKSQHSNAVWQGSAQSYTGMFCPTYLGPGFISPKPSVSADLSWADVTKGAELKQEVVVGEGHLCVGNAAVVTCRDQRGKESLNEPLTGEAKQWLALTRALKKKKSRALTV